MTREEQIYADLQECMKYASAGLCYHTAGAKHAYLEDIKAIGKKYGADALGELQPLREVSQ